jgi:hypothetical protein
LVKRLVKRLVKAYFLLLRRVHFRGFVNGYLLVLSLLSFANVVVCEIWWVRPDFFG